jgi:hypothetical protein
MENTSERKKSKNKGENYGEEERYTCVQRQSRGDCHEHEIAD